jgi:hypothetical protein
MFENTKDTIRQWIKLEHWRLHSVEEWPSSAHKIAVLESIRATLTRLEQSNETVEMLCTVCASRRPKSNVIEFPRKARGLTLVTRPAA